MSFFPFSQDNQSIFLKFFVKVSNKNHLLKLCRKKGFVSEKIAPIPKNPKFLSKKPQFLFFFFKKRTF